MRNILATAASVLAVMAAVPYLLDIIKRRTKPNVVSWFTWTLLLVIATAGAFAAHQTRTALLTLGDTVGTGLTLLLGLKYGIAKYSIFDVICQVGAFIGLAFWLIFNSPTVGIVAVLIIDLLGSLPTMRHSWQNPGEETWQTFAVIVVACSLTLLSLNMFTVASLAYPIYLLLANLAVVLVVVYRRKQLGISLSRHSVHETLHE